MTISRGTSNEFNFIIPRKSIERGKANAVEEIPAVISTSAFRPSEPQSHYSKFTISGNDYGGLQLVTRMLEAGNVPFLLVKDPHALIDERITVNWAQSLNRIA